MLSRHQDHGAAATAGPARRKEIPIMGTERESEGSHVGSPFVGR